MKRCPQCNRIEADDTPTFCRADGTALISASGSFSGNMNTAKVGSAPSVPSDFETNVVFSIRSLPPPHAGCPRGDPGPLAVPHLMDGLAPVD
ncbi:MAG: hypothetical protein ACR2H4_03615 [Pyrinomonadaceae bacterium]